MNKNLRAGLIPLWFMGSLIPLVAQTFNYDVALDFIPGPDPQSPTAVWQYFEASFDRTTMTHLTDWDLEGNEVFDTFPQWDNNLGNGKYPFVQKTDPGGPWPGNFGSADFPGDSLIIHPSNGAEAPGAAVGFYNDRIVPVILTFNVTFTIVQNVNNDDGVRYYIQVQTVGDPHFVEVADGFIDKSNLAATESGTGLVLQPGQFVYFGVDNGGPNNNYFWDHTLLQLTVTATEALPFQITDITASAEQVVLSWNSRPGRDYTVEFKTDLSNPFWTEVDDGVASGGTTTSFTDNDPARTGLPQGYYRVRRN
jgi:hypothetical protein